MKVKYMTSQDMTRWSLGSQGRNNKFMSGAVGETSGVNWVTCHTQI